MTPGIGKLYQMRGINQATLPSANDCLQVFDQLPGLRPRGVAEREPGEDALAVG